ncbi:cation-transporting P-type ATPase [Sporocytophaga sp.]|uniref:cation-translocating P-type ATPase n=1 Tax=Sporocytophaga sp. TaxID=2231183 RepID=UPI0025DF0A5C|nr:cation-transporting P-type ATPase [Sporocytophaga sp.]
MLDKSGFSFELLFHALSGEKVMDFLLSDPKKGLNADEAESRIVQYGPNKLADVKEKSILKILLEQFQNAITYLLAGAAIISLFFHDVTNSIAIGGVILINALIGFFIELQARKSMEGLRSLEISLAKVVRGSELSEINSALLAIGDLVYIKAGDMVPADGRLVNLNNLEINESPLTGESLPVDKICEPLPEPTPLADRTNMVYKGTSVIKGNGYFLVTATGLHTELGKISTMTQSTENVSTPLDAKLEKLTKTLIWITAAMACIFIVAGLLRKQEFYTIVETAIALAVAAIPEGLPIVSTIALAYGMLRLAKRNAIIKKLYSVETLGGTNIIFTDKTGTLTENVMEVNLIAFPHKTFELKSDFDKRKNLFSNGEVADVENTLHELYLTAALCNNASLNLSTGKAIGDPLEIALLKLAYSGGIDTNEIKGEYFRVNEKPFSSDTKMMAVMVKSRDGFIVTSKGSVEAILSKCRKYRKDSEVLPIDSSFIKHLHNEAERISSMGLRVLAFAIKHQAEEEQEYLKDLTFIGLVGFLDPPRHDIGFAMESCKTAGVKVIMVTGDHPKTGFTIAKKIGIVEDEEEANSLMTGAQLQELDIYGRDKERVMNTRVFARVTPAQKFDLVSLYQSEGNIVAMTGDGINDTPALKKADIGIAMGTRGTQVAKDTADVVLKDDSFVSIVEAIFQGRVIFQNIREFIIFLLSCNLSEIVLVVASGFIDPRIVLLPLQILFLNIITDVFPALALGLGQGDRLVMKLPPRNPEAPMLNSNDWKSLVAYCICISGSILCGVLFFEKHYANEPAIIQDMVFYSLAFSQLWHVFNLSSAKSSFFINEITRNKFVWMALAFCSSMLAITGILPAVQRILQVKPLSIEIWGGIILISLMPVVLIQLLKRLLRIID